jgi:hypothetical protein
MVHTSVHTTNEGPIRERSARSIADEAAYLHERIAEV